MPELSRFLGIVVRMFYDDHPPSHFHIQYAEKKARFGIDPPVLLHGRLPPRVLGLVFEWTAAHRAELLERWAAAEQGRPLDPIMPLE